jgi:hypothetical protein
VEACATASRRSSQAWTAYIASVLLWTVCLLVPGRKVRTSQAGPCCRAVRQARPSLPALSDASGLGISKSRREAPRAI